MIVAWLKLIHIAAISLWAFGLMALPPMLMQRNRVAGDAALHNLHRATRYYYLVFLSPAAAIAVISGTALIFLAQVYSPWFAAKLAFVAVLCMMHGLAAGRILKVFGEEARYPRWMGFMSLFVTIGTVGIILFLVLGKPVLTGPDLPLLRPGGLSELFPGLPSLRPE
ncbi:hypothetical protein CDV50_18640 [Haematobacter massiliensis]|uniref:CopD family protein n=1 Tax=Haematobacter massiliensis TaxID=195105 RepID=UPI00068E2775|nr:CopD family protein [Haematobacter massiliensis]OWJ69312.1 hypothetical protein CDV50_18640 [Haematobacter massiliensis]OWJ81241.1 hypothetical protein CDV51_19685 [Haematobacter massiliensis]QBJ24984.1 hypothetical protein HmaOT1_12455 [Haematobacter massiliensis]